MSEKWHPHKYQLRAVKFCLERAHAGLFLSPGLGKSSILLSVFKILKSKGFVDYLLILAPLRAVYSVWPKEVEKWDEFKKFSVGILHGPNKNEVLKKKHDIYVTNYDSLSWLVSKKLPPGRGMLGVDESSKLKHTGTSRYKLAKSLTSLFKRRYILTGSPAANSLLDLFGQMYVMDRGESFGPYISHFRNKYFDKSGFGGYIYVLKKDADKEIFARVAPRVLRMSAKDYLELPELVITDIRVDLPEKALRIYKQMELQLRVDFEAGIVRAANAAVASMKCRQIANGGLYTSKDTWENIHEAKSEAVLDIVEELQGQPALISYDFLHDLERLKNVLGKDTPHIGGGVSPAQSKRYEEAWNRGELKCLIGHPQSMAHALNLQGKKNLGGAVILHSLPWSYELYDQFIQRVWRQGQKKRVIVYRIIAKSTIDEAIVKVLSTKQERQDALFEALKNYFAF